MEMTREELESLMVDSAHNAVTTTREEFGIELDFSQDSINQVDEVLLRWLERYKSEALEEQAVFTLCNIYGAYVGEVFRKHIGGHWVYDDTNPDAPTIMLEYAGKTYAFAATCYQRLVNDNQISVQKYYELAVNKATPTH
ncbi:hypothetical protein HMF8227_01728 [Saliniradius amylolyticus]|uniref:DUF3806 domain-containing protein n=1 Tax=Saliniradius amylolyticus TaxID=2183582 RepID=A0A2S2E3I3_9ALTE|nr:hypothetical protein [Saliniradius amylolyticus]AWL12201.1 hypothetical protein HMF8227_01728 [Saliniradius amylolyticus]